MRTVFADTAYWIATVNPKDHLHRTATEVARHEAEHRLVTSELVLVELLNAVCASGAHVRSAAARLVTRLSARENVEIVPLSPALFRDALSLYADRSDKSWSLTDCASFLIMDRRQIRRR